MEPTFDLIESSCHIKLRDRHHIVAVRQVFFVPVAPALCPPAGPEIRSLGRNRRTGAGPPRNPTWEKNSSRLGGNTGPDRRRGAQRRHRGLSLSVTRVHVKATMSQLTSAWRSNYCFDQRQGYAVAERRTHGGNVWY